MKNMGETNSRLSLPGRIMNLLLTDDQFYREVAQNKKAALPNFPKYDQWSDDDGFNMEFALAGFSNEDLLVSYHGYTLCIESGGSSTQAHSNPLEVAPACEETTNDLGDEYSKETSPKLTCGVIVRGIARRSFRVDFFISPIFDLKKVSASMSNGLLNIFIPRCAEHKRVCVSVKNTVDRS